MDTPYRFKHDKKMMSEKAFSWHDHVCVIVFVDYPEDFDVICSIFNEFYPGKPTFSMEDIIAYLRANPDIMAKNATINPNQGWKPALEKDLTEGYVNLAFSPDRDHTIP